MVAAVTQFVCERCINENFVKQLIAKSNYSANACTFCERPRPLVISIDELAELVRAVIEEHFQMTDPEPEGLDYLLAKEGRWEQPGESVDEVIEMLLETPGPVPSAVLEYLAENYNDHSPDGAIEIQPYGPEAMYEEKPIEAYEFLESWDRFKTEIGSRFRFFSPRAKELLDFIFRDLDDLPTASGTELIRVLGPDSEQALYRARTALSSESLLEIAKGLPDSLGPPPSSAARAGRMNAAGISVFYGAFQLETALAEVRPPVGSDVIIGKFIPRKELRLLDLNLLKDALLAGSYFDRKHTEAIKRVHFLRILNREISAPILPGTEESKYLPTQAVTEYLASRSDLNLDGLIYDSSQIAGSSQNMMLFNRASGVEELLLPPGSHVEAMFLADSEDDPPFLQIWETIPQEDEKNAVVKHLPFPVDPPEKAKAEAIEPSIALDLNSVEVLKIEGVQHHHASLEVRRTRFRSDYERF